MRPFTPEYSTVASAAVKTFTAVTNQLHWCHQQHYPVIQVVRLRTHHATYNMRLIETRRLGCVRSVRWVSGSRRVCEGCKSAANDSPLVKLFVSILSRNLLFSLVLLQYSSPKQAVAVCYEHISKHKCKVRRPRTSSVQCARSLIPFMTPIQCNMIACTFSRNTGTPFSGQSCRHWHANTPAITSIVSHVNQPGPDGVIKPPAMSTH